MKMKSFTICALALAISACGNGENTNNPGEISLSGIALEGQTITATVTDNDGVIASTLRFQWRSGNSLIDGANGPTLELTADQVGDPVSVVASYDDEAGFTEVVLSRQTTDVERLIVNIIGTLSISGEAIVGSLLSASLSDENGIGESINYQWVADGQAIEGAADATFEITEAQIGTAISLMVTYTDNDGFDETLSSDSTAPVIAAPSNSQATISIAESTLLVAGTQVVSTLVDGNGSSNATDYVWMADDVVIAGANTSTYTPTSDDRGKVLSVSISFTDDEGFSETASATASGVVHTVITDSLADLVAASATLVDGDVIGINTGNYANTDTDAIANSMTFTANNLLIQPVLGSTAVISGPMCFELNGDGITVDGLRFADVNTLNGSNCASSGGSAITMRGDGVTFSNNVIDSEQVGRDQSAQFSWIALRGVGSTITRNSFTDSTGQKALTSGGVISVYSSATAGVNQDHTISYNLFKDFPDNGTAGDRNGSAYMIQLGRSTGADSQGVLNTSVQFNLFKNVTLDRRYIKVQSGGNTIDSNTFLDGSGMIALEDGNNNVVSNNIIINSLSDNSDDGGISYGPFGHTISNNYIAGLRTTSGDRAGLYANSDVITNSGNATSTIALVTVANNSIFNSREALEFGSRECSASAQFIVDFDNNLIANDEEGDNLGLASNGRSREAIQDDCDLDASSDFDNNHIYSRDITNSGSSFFALFVGSAGNIEGAQGDADIAQASNGLWQGQNADADIGADVSALTFLTEADVGPGSEN
ncbi:hypothetical protein ISG33_12255 [Glaciecola sp. MH2013]|uniref:chondroitinase-B domain-containing protein n=1 Tax=Glaciecola sp. MH2013 TaxID=2785524 RepID=UPI00189CC815|nr:chondroitinase-B domain-containing protein [Glaciecola sp. MH2013]MBF7074174.1 hypothetical protein [Glaciecola sp. MH2013]